MTLLAAARDFIKKTEHHRAVIKEGGERLLRGELKPGDSYGGSTHTAREIARIEFERLCQLADVGDPIVATYQEYLEVVQILPGYVEGDEKGKQRVEELIQKQKDTWARFVKACSMEVCS